MAPRRLTITRTAAGLAMLCLASAEGRAQMAGVPVLQNAFTNRGLAFAANFGGGSGQSAYGAAASWGLGGVADGDGRLSISFGAGAQRANEATRGTYGGRVATRLWASRGGALGFGAFAGVGGAPRTHAGTTTTNPAVLNIPAGVSVGYRRAIGERRGISLYGAPFYSWTRTEADTSVTSGTIRFSAGLDFALSRTFGVTVGGEFGGKTDDGEKSGTLGAAVSFIPGRR